MCEKYRTFSPVVAAVMEQLQDKVEAKDRVIAQKEQTLAAAEAIIQQLKEALRLERIRKYRKQSEKLSDLQLELLDREPAVSSDEMETEAASGHLPDVKEKAGEGTPQRKNKQHPGRNELPAHLERIEEIIACAVDECRCGRCGAQPCTAPGTRPPRCSMSCTRCLLRCRNRARTCRSRLLARP